MHYLRSMQQILTLNPLEKKMDLKRLQFYAIINVLMLGLIYGCFAALFSQEVLVEKGFEVTGFNPFKIIVAGIPVAFFMHCGAALFVWVFFLAIGGKTNFLNCYFHMGMTAISLWPVAPLAAALQTGSASSLTLALSVIFSLYALAVNVRVLQTAFGLSSLKMTIATLVTLTYISCFLYLWV